MGIAGLLPFLKKASRQCNLHELSGTTAAMDVYCWLHKGAFACAEALAMDRPTDQYVHYCLKYIRMVLSYNIKLVLVFDGANLPAKADTEKKRRENRENYRRKAAQFLLDGKKAEARECFERCINVTSGMALQVINAARDIGVDCIVAPYEADAQLAFLNKCGIADVVLTEDSDLMLFGCSQVAFKLDLSGNCVLVERSKLPEACSIKPEQFTFDKFRYMGILAGCDYFSGINGIGLTTAAKIMQKTRLTKFEEILSKLGMYMSKAPSNLTKAAITSALEAENTFRFQIVFDPLKRIRRPLSPYPTGRGSLDYPYAGQILQGDDYTALEMAHGNLDFSTLKKVGNFDPETFQAKNPIRLKPPAQMEHHEVIRDITSFSQRGPKTDHYPAHLRSIWSRDYCIRAPVTSQPLSIPEITKAEVKDKGTLGQTIMIPYRLERQSRMSLTMSQPDDNDLLLTYKEEEEKNDREACEALNSADLDDLIPGGGARSPVFKRTHHVHNIFKSPQAKRERFSLDSYRPPCPEDTRSPTEKATSIVQPLPASEISSNISKEFITGRQETKNTTKKNKSPGIMSLFHWASTGSRESTASVSPASRAAFKSVVASSTEKVMNTESVQNGSIDWSTFSDNDDQLETGEEARNQCEDVTTMITDVEFGGQDEKQISHILSSLETPSSQPPSLHRVGFSEPNLKRIPAPNSDRWREMRSELKTSTKPTETDVTGEAAGRRLIGGLSRGRGQRGGVCNVRLTGRGGMNRNQENNKPRSELGSLLTHWKYQAKEKLPIGSTMTNQASKRLPLSPENSSSAHLVLDLT